MSRDLNSLAVILLLFSFAQLASAQYGGGTTYPNCNTCQYGTYYAPSNAPTYWNCACTGTLCSYTPGQGTVVTSCSQAQSTTTVATTTSTAQTTTVQTSNATTQSPNATTTAATTLATTVATTQPTTSISYTYGSGYSSGLAYYVLIAIVAVVAIFGLVKLRALPTRLAIIGAALILIGTIAWLYGNYGGPGSYILGGVYAIVIGLVVWIIGDVIGGTFKKSVPAILTIVGIILIIAGTWAWYYIGSPNAILGGVAALVIGTFVWLYGDAQAGAFIMGKPKK
ncbi:MAG: hypothetical protein KGH49_04025 [Candidatus Micrarchaeota archaeon]|nr:hypothetical protein [Candidatus Micrarchaeota archaeon]